MFMDNIIWDFFFSFRYLGLYQFIIRSLWLVLRRLKLHSLLQHFFSIRLKWLPLKHSLALEWQPLIVICKEPEKRTVLRINILNVLPHVTCFYLMLIPGKGLNMYILHINTYLHNKYIYIHYKCIHIHMNIHIYSRLLLLYTYMVFI